MRPNSILAVVFLIGPMIPVCCRGQAAAESPPSTLNRSADPELAARIDWSKQMRGAPLPGEGCFHARYPALRWEKLSCAQEPLRARLGGIDQRGGLAKRWGVTERSVAVAQGTISIATGLFPSVSINGEQSVGGSTSGAIDGWNEYSLQINTNPDATTAACKKHVGCTVWQQFTYLTDGLGKGKAAVTMQYWLLNFGSKNCPSHWHSTTVGSELDCVRNSKSIEAPNIPPSALGASAVVLSAVATPGGDAVTLFDGLQLWTVGAKDTMLDISSVWNEAEFNIFGDAGDSQAQFDGDASVTVLLSYTDGTSMPPFCLLNQSVTGETNNLIPLPLSCEVGTNQLPFMQFTEVLVPPPPPPKLTCAQLLTIVSAAETTLHAAQHRLHTPACENGLSVECLNQVKVAEQALTAAEGRYRKNCP